MKINIGNVPMSYVYDDVSLEKELQADFVALENEITQLKDICACNNGLLVKNIQLTHYGIEGYGLEGIVKDIVKTATYTAPKALSKAGATGYKELNKHYGNFKLKWNKTIKPLIIKSIKNIGNILESMYFKFTNLNKRYDELAKKIDYARLHQLKQIGNLTYGRLTIHDFQPGVMKGYIDIMADFKEYYNTFMNDKMPNHNTSDEIIDMINKKNADAIRKVSDEYTKTVASINEYGDISIPWEVFKSNKFNKRFRDLLKRKPSADERKMIMGDYVKKTIIGDEVVVEVENSNKAEFVKIANSFLEPMGSLLKNKVLEKTLKTGGKSITEQTKSFYSDIDKISKRVQTLKPEKKNEDDKSDVASEEEKLVLDVESYIMNALTVISKCSSAYTGITKGTLSALFVLTGDAEKIVSIIETSVGSKTDSKKAMSETVEDDGKDKGGK